MRLCRACGMALALLAPVAAYANVTPVSSPSAPASLMQVVLGLLVVLGAILAFAWLSRRFLPGHAAHTALAGLRVVGGVYVGPKERVVVVEIDNTWLLLGVTSTGINTLHTMDRPAQAESSTVSPGPATPFSHWIQQALNKSARGQSDAAK